MIMTNGTVPLIAGIDCREEIPVVCYQTAQMKEPDKLPLDFRGQTGRGAVFRKILSGLKHYGKKEDIRAALVLPDTSEETIRQYVKEACEAGFFEEQLTVMGEAESIVHFVMRQTSDIWQQRVYLLEFETEGVNATWVDVNRRTVPMLVEVSEKDYWYVGNLLDGSRDERLSETVKTHFGKKGVSAVFLTGTDLNERDYKKSREELCFRRRVFLGEQIHARGACAAAEDAGKKKTYLFLNEQTLLYNVGLKSSRGGKESLYTVISAGMNWYEAKASCEMILLGDPVLEFIFQPMLGGEPVRANLTLTDLPKRPEATTRLLLDVHFSGPHECEIKVTDLGCGELYPSSDLYWRETVWLEKQEEDTDGAGDDLQI